MESKDELAKKFKDNNSPLKIAIVVDMWLTGFDVPSLATMYVYKPMSGHNLMQAIARVNRVFRDKEGGLVVDYVGIATALKKAMNDYTARDKKNYGDTDVAKVAFPKFQEKLSVCRDKFHGFDYSKFQTGTDLERSKTISGAVNFIMGREKIDDKDSFVKEALDLFSTEWLNDTLPKMLQLAKQAEIMSNKYAVVCTNPPYMNKLEGQLKKFRKRI